MTYSWKTDFFVEKKLIEAEITYLNKADAETFIKNYNEAKLDDQELKIYLL